MTGSDGAATLPCAGSIAGGMNPDDIGTGGNTAGGIDGTKPGAAWPSGAPGSGMAGSIQG